MRFALLMIVLILPPVLLANRCRLLAWLVHYLLAALPVAYACDRLGEMKYPHDCNLGGTDVTVLVGHGLC